jgi:hypothetical protein
MTARPATTLLACLGLSACTFYLGEQASSRRTVDRPAETAEAPSADPALHERECSALRADIGSSRYNQRNATPTTTSPIIAEANEAKAQKKIDDLQKRYDDMGCVGPAKPLSPLNPAVPGPAADNPLAK